MSRYSLFRLAARSLILSGLLLASACTSFEICDAVVDAEDDKYVCVNQGII